jgi:uncharacterized membrane protein YkoI
MRTIFTTIAIVAAVGMGATGASAKTQPHRYTGQELAPMAKVTMARARAIALKAHPGVITDAELEKEAGGTGLRYSFDIKSKGQTKTFEIGVDARTGAVLENKAEGKNPD